MNYTLIFFIWLILTIIFKLSYDYQQKRVNALAAKQLLELKQPNVDENLLSIAFIIAKQEEVNGYIRNRIYGAYGGIIQELIVSLKKNIPPSLVDGKPANLFIPEGIILESVGKTSDLLLSHLSQQYGLNNKNLKLKKKLIFTCANLNNEEIDYQNSNVLFKIFLQNEEEYAELYVQFNFAKGIIAFTEKDTAHRQTIINLLKA